MNDGVHNHPSHERLRSLLLLLTAFSLILVWLPFWRSVMDGPSYRWGVDYFGESYGGAGLDGDILFLGYQLFLGLTILVLGHRGAREPFALLLPLWHAVLAASALYGALAADEPLIFQGDTLGIRADVTYVAPIVYGVVFLLAALWSIREIVLRPARPAPRWTVVNAIGCAGVVVLLGAGHALLSTGEPHGQTDQIGVFVTIANLFVLHFALSER